MSKEEEIKLRAQAIMEHDVDKFKNDFFDKHHIVPTVYIGGGITKLGYKTLSLLKIEAVINLLFVKEHGHAYPKGIRDKVRKGEMVLYRQMYFTFAREYGYGLSEIGRFLKTDANPKGFDHATVLFGSRKIAALIEVKNQQVINLYNIIKQELSHHRDPKKKNMGNLVEASRAYAIGCHDLTNDVAGKKPYELFLIMVAGAIDRFIDLVPEHEASFVRAAGWAHGVMANCREDYEDVKRNTTKEIADLVYAVTAHKGRTHNEKYPEEYYKTIKETPNATLLACCIRIAQLEFYQQEDREIFKKLLEGNPQFIKKLSMHEYYQAFDYLENVFSEED